MKHAVAVVAFLIVVSTVSADQHGYRIATVQWIGWAPLQVAHRLGFWDSYGVDVTPVLYDDPLIVFEAIRAGRCEFAMDMVGTLVGEFLEGRDVIALFESDWSHGGDIIVHKNGVDISSLKGETAGVFLDYPSCLYFLDRYLSTRKMKLSDFRVVELRPHYLADQFIAGRISLIVIYEPHAGRAVIDGDGVVAATSATYEGCVPECMWTHSSILDDIPPDDVRSILHGWIDAVEWIAEEKNFEEFMRIVNEDIFMNTDPLSEHEFRRLVRTVRFHSVEMLRERNLDGGGLTDYLINLHGFLEKNGMLIRDFRPEDVYDSFYISSVLEER